MLKGIGVVKIIESCMESDDLQKVRPQTPNQIHGVNFVSSYIFKAKTLFELFSVKNDKDQQSEFTLFSKQI